MLRAAGTRPRGGSSFRRDVLPGGTSPNLALSSGGSDEAANDFVDDVAERDSSLRALRREIMKPTRAKQGVVPINH